MRVFDFIPEGVQDGTVTAWIHTEGENHDMEERKLPSVIICPGGGYRFVSNREAEPIAQRYFAAGYNTFILKYAIKEMAKDLYPLRQLAATMAHVRMLADDWHVDAEKIAVCGFSAGGHLAGSLGTLIHTDEFRIAYGRQENVRPNAMVLVYPVITADEHTHAPSIQKVSGSEVGSEKYKWFGLHNHVGSWTPPTFLCHMADDPDVPVQNSLKMAYALSEAKIPYELHILPEGGHGVSVCTEAVGNQNAYNGRWVEWSIMWLNKLFDFIM